MYSNAVPYDDARPREPDSVPDQAPARSILVTGLKILRITLNQVSFNFFPKLWRTEDVEQFLRSSLPHVFTLAHDYFQVYLCPSSKHYTPTFSQRYNLLMISQMRTA